VITVLGIDPGDTAGFLLAGWVPGGRRAAFGRAFQCDGASAPGLCEMILAAGPRPGAVQIEAFDDRPGVTALHGTRPPAIRAQIDAMAGILREAGVPVFTRRAADVLPWINAGDERLARAGLLDAVSPATMRHAKSAAWHCLYCAVRNCGIPDPASRKAAAR